MKRYILALLCGLLGILVTAVAIPPRVNGQAEIPTEKLVNALRLLNTQEYSYRHETGRFATREEMLTFLRKKGTLNESPMDLENPKPYELAIATSPDGMHYQVTLKRPSDMKDKSTWCRTAAFSDDAGVIFLGAAIDCKMSTP
jgi:hypothetical protein